MDRGVDDGGNSSGPRGHAPSGDGGAVAIRHAALQHASSTAPARQQARPVVVVLGMHRSGTSLLSNALHILGVDMADGTDHVSPKNAGGFWERPELVAIQDEILGAIGRPIALPSHVLPFPPAWWRSKEVQALKRKLVDYVRDQLDQSPNPWGFKDPRTCRLLPLWREIFRDLNLEPIYVVAVRTPSESSSSMSQKSSARKLSVGTSELMWLSYNYDIARYVTSKSPAITVDYQDWFDDPVEVAARITGRLGIGLDLTPDEMAECMKSLVRDEYRHQFDGEKGVSAGIPIATMLYEAMSAHRLGGDQEAAKLRAQLRLVDLYFKSVTPMALDLDAAARAEAELRAERDEISRARDEIGLARDEAERQLAELREAHQRESNQGNQNKSALENEIQQLRQVVAEAEQKLAELGSGLESSRREKDQIDQRRAALESDVQRLSQINDEAEGKLAELAAGFDDLTARNQLLEQDKARSDQRLAELAASFDDLTARHQLLEQDKARSDERLAELEIDRNAQQQALMDAERRLEQTREEAIAALARSRRRSRILLTSAKDWRGRHRAEHGAPEARLAAVDEAAAAHRMIMSMERRLAAAEERNARLVADLEARDLTLAHIATGAAVAADPDAPPPIFAWPHGEEPAIEVEGRIDRVDRVGIVGRIAFTNRPDIVPAIEIRINGSMVHARSCVAADPGAGAGPKWQFIIPWRDIAPDFSGLEAVLVVAGLGQEIGRAAIPANLRSLHLPPAVRAAEAIGGTVAQAAEYHRWLAQQETPDELASARQYRSAMTVTPLITVLVYEGDDPKALLTLQSLQAQLYGNWAAIFIDSTPDLADLDPRVSTLGSMQLDQGLAGLADDALFTFMQAGDTVAPTALLHLAAEAARRDDFGLIYSDEDRIDAESGLRADPHMKGDFSPELAWAQDYLSRLALMRGDRLQSGIPRNLPAVHEAALRAATSGEGPVIHLPFVLYHRLAEHQTHGLAKSVQSVLDASAEHSGARATDTASGHVKVAWPLPDPLPLVSLVVPTRDRVDLLRVCVDGFLNETRYPNSEVLIADNDSQEAATKIYLEKVATHPRVRVVPCPGPFNFSRINNLAVAQAKGSIIGLMNNDLKVLDADWLREMVAYAVRPDIGITGAKLLHADRTVQHAGVTMGIGIASHIYKFWPGGAEGPRGRLILPQDLSAVTAACLLMRRDVWDEVGGLDEEFPVAYNDVDLCLRVREAGYRIVWNPDALVFHLESQSRGKEDTSEKRERFNEDKARLTERWGKQLTSDPFHSPNLSNRHVDGRLAFPSRATPPWQALEGTSR